jgi:4-coumarate--CoA ligase
VCIIVHIKSFKVSPTELEEELRNVNGIADVAVIGVPDKAHGEVPKAFVVKKAGAEVTEQQISEYLKGRVAEFKFLRGGVSFVQEIPRSAAGKIERKALKSL